MKINPYATTGNQELLQAEPGQSRLLVVVRVSIAVLAIAVFFFLGFQFLKAMSDHRWIPALLSAAGVFAAIPWTSHRAAARNCLTASIALSVGTCSAAGMMLFYFMLFQLDWFERIFNDKGMGPLGLFVFAGAGFAAGAYLCWRLLCLTPLPLEPSVGEFFAAQPDESGSESR